MVARPDGEGVGLREGRVSCWGDEDSCSQIEVVMAHIANGPSLTEVHLEMVHFIVF